MTALLEALTTHGSRIERASQADFEAGKRLENDFPAISKTVALPSKFEIARLWLVEHPEDMELTGRELKELRKPMGVEISHKTWNDVKKALRPDSQPAHPKTLLPRQRF